MKYLETNEQDIDQIQKWTKADCVHKGVIAPSFWIPPVDADGHRVPGIKCLKVEDEVGCVFYMRFENAVRVYVQFPPEAEVEKSRLGSALRRMFFFLGGGLKKTGYHEAIFDSQSDHLVEFMKSLGIESLKDTYRAIL